MEMLAVDARLPDGTTPLILAAALGADKDRQADVVTALLEFGADPVATDCRGYTVPIISCFDLILLIEIF